MQTALQDRIQLKVKLKAGSLYFFQHDLVFEFTTSYNRIRDIFSITTKIKPISVDDAYWDVIHEYIKDDLGGKKFPFSHRIDGAFTVPRIHLDGKLELSIDDPNWQQTACDFILDQWAPFSQMKTAAEFRQYIRDKYPEQLQRSDVLDLMLHYVLDEKEEIINRLANKELSWDRDKFSFDRLGEPDNKRPIGFREVLLNYVRAEMA